MLFAIVTRKNSDGSFDNVGMNNRFVVRGLKTKRGILKRIPDNYKQSGCRVELFRQGSLYDKPFEVLYLRG
jgi:hypothetical protein